MIPRTAEFYLRSHAAALAPDSPVCVRLTKYLRAEGGSAHMPPEAEDQLAVHRVYRGGSWSYAAQLCRPMRRFRHHPDTRVNDLGLRPVRGLGPG